MTKVACALCGKSATKKANEAWSLCPQCESTLPKNAPKYTPENDDLLIGGNMGAGTGSENHPVLHVAGYRGDVQQVAGPIWRVKSETAEKWYTVDLDIPKCDCTDWATKRNKLVSAARAVGKPDASVRYACKHVKAAQTGDATAGAQERKAEKEALDKQTAEIKRIFTANKTKQSAIDMLREIDEGL